MIKEFKLSMMALGIVAGGFLSACSNEGLEPDQNGASNLLIRNTKTSAYSGSQVWGDTRSNAGDGWIGNGAWENKGAEALTNITDEERQAVLDAIKEKVTGSRISEDVVFPWTEYFLQDVISGQNGNWTGAGSNGTSSSSYTFEAWNTGAKCNQQYWPGYDYENYEEVTNSAHMNQYYQKQNADGSQTRINETTLMTGMQYGTYEEMKGKQFRWYINCHENLHWYEYIVVKVDGNYYICFDFGCGHPENDVDGNPGRGAEHNDWDYNDWIIKITPAGEQPDVWGETPEEPQETCPKCGHPQHDENCDECEPGDGCYHESDQPVPENPVPDVKTPRDHVEVNLTVEDFTENKQQSHLSIHVRSVTDVEVFVPVPYEWLCKADDMALVQQHKEELMQHGGQMVDGNPDLTKTTYIINGVEVSLYVELGVKGMTSADGQFVFPEDGIHVWSDGINADLIAYLEENFHDGITFEVWNYFQDGVDEWQLKEYFDRAFVKFLDKLPDAYVNAYNDTAEGDMYDRDCHVGIEDSQAGAYDGPEKDYHYNGSPYNDIYTNKNAQNSSGEE